VKGPIVASATVFTVVMFFVPMHAAAQTSTVAPADAPSRAVVPPTGEPGTPIVIFGTVSDASGTPLRGASVYVYQTDARGYYDPSNPRASDRPRLKAYMRTDAQGRYEFRTIRPGSYPGTNNPGHVHYHVVAPGYRERVFEIVFEGDSLIPPQWRAQAKSEDSGVAIVALARDAAGPLRGAQNVRLQRQ
jgi:protocatechuate 3,4-dioxygenase beta subunit